MTSSRSSAVDPSQLGLTYAALCLIIRLLSLPAKTKPFLLYNADYLFPIIPFRSDLDHGHGDVFLGLAALPHKTVGGACDGLTPNGGAGPGRVGVLGRRLARQAEVPLDVVDGAPRDAAAVGAGADRLAAAAVVGGRADEDGLEGGRAGAADSDADLDHAPHVEDDAVVERIRRQRVLVDGVQADQRRDGCEGADAEDHDEGHLLPARAVHARERPDGQAQDPHIRCDVEGRGCYTRGER